MTTKESNMENVLETLKTIGMWVLIIVGILLILAFIGLDIYAWVVYGGKPVTEIPSWVLWLMWGK